MLGNENTTRTAFWEAAACMPKDVLKELMHAETFCHKATEIRLRLGQPLTVEWPGGRTELPACTVTDRMLNEVFQRICDYTVHAHLSEIRNGFITLRGGHRAGFCGTAVSDADGKLSSVKNVTSINIRVARNIPVDLTELLHRIPHPEDGILIVGAPLTGKTTLLRSLAKEYAKKRKISIVDERGELGQKGTRLFQNCDLFDGYEKSLGIEIALRTMSPELIFCDEIGNEAELKGILSCLQAGVGIVASIHARDRKQLSERPIAKKLLESGAVGTVILLESGAVGKIEDVFVPERGRDF